MCDKVWAVQAGPVPSPCVTAVMTNLPSPCILLWDPSPRLLLAAGVALADGTGLGLTVGYPHPSCPSSRPSTFSRCPSSCPLQGDP